MAGCASRKTQQHSGHRHNTTCCHYCCPPPPFIPSNFTGTIYRCHYCCPPPHLSIYATQFHRRHRGEPALCIEGPLLPSVRRKAYIKSPLFSQSGMLTTGPSVRPSISSPPKFVTRTTSSNDNTASTYLPPLFQGKLRPNQNIPGCSTVCRRDPRVASGGLQHLAGRLGSGQEVFESLTASVGVEA